MAFGPYLSTFDDPLDDTETTQDPKDPKEVAIVAETVRGKLAVRFAEENEERGDFKIRYAARRIDGSIARGKQQRRTAIAYGAISEFVAVIDSIIAEAQRALAVAVTPRQEPEKSRGKWIDTSVPKSTIPDFLDDI
jgi:hypothetical protein